MSGLVKHFQNDMKNIPQLSNNWGSMINLLDKVLVEGFNFVPVISVSKSSSDAITATISLGSGHGFIDRQVVRIAGSTNGWDGDYKVLSANTDSVVVECAATNPIAINGAASCSTAPLDFEIVFRTPVGSTEPKRAYRSKDPESLGLILLVHDFCVSGAAASGAKFAKVGVVSSMSDIDTITGTQMPYDSSNPNANWGWDGTYHGWAKWYYSCAAGEGDDTRSPNSSNRSYFVSGDTLGFGLSIQNGAEWASHVCSEFFDQLINSQNFVISAAGAIGRRSQGQTLNPVFYSMFRLGRVYGTEYAADGGVRADWLFWNERNNLYAGGGYPMVFGMRYLDSGGNFQFTENYQYDLKNEYQYPVILSDSDGYFRGVMPFFAMSALNNSNGLVFGTQTGKVFRFRSYGSKYVKMSHLLERR